MKVDYSKRSRDKYCRFHRDYDHDTSDCYDLKQQIEALTRQRKLQRFIGKEMTNQPQEPPTGRENKHPRPPVEDIRMIVGGTTSSGSSKKARKTYLWMVQNVQLMRFVPKIARIDSLVIRFTEEDATRLHHPHNDVLVVSIQMGDYNTHQVLVDNGSFADILYYPTFHQMRINWEQGYTP